MFCSTRRCGNNAWSWNTSPMRRFSGGSAETSVPSRTTRPLTTGSSPAIARNSDDLPHPLGPTITTSSPSATSNDTPSTTSRPAMRRVMSLTDNAGRGWSSTASIEVGTVAVVRSSRNVSSPGTWRPAMPVGVVTTRSPRRARASTAVPPRAPCRPRRSRATAPQPAPTGSRTSPATPRSAASRCRMVAAAA